MRWRWWRHKPTPGEHTSWPDHGRDLAGRLHDGDQVRPAGWDGWHDLLPGYEALTEPTQILPTIDHPSLVDSMTPAQQWRGRGGAW